MRTRMYIVCDNPACRETELSETSSFDGDKEQTEWDRKTLKNLLPPYGWLDTTVSFFGSGPTVRTVTCSIECVADAVRDKLKDAEP